MEEKQLRVAWTRLALKDLNDAVAYIFKENPSAAFEFSKKIGQSVEFIREHPSIGRTGALAGTREWIVAGMPYFIPYRLKGNVLDILRVYHSSRQWPPKGTKGNA